MTSSDDLPARLRLWAELDKIEAMPLLAYDLAQAADRIEELEAELGELVDGLRNESELSPEDIGMVLVQSDAELQGPASVWRFPDDQQ